MTIINACVILLAVGGALAQYQGYDPLSGYAPCGPQFPTPPVMMPYGYDNNANHNQNINVNDNYNANAARPLYPAAPYYPKPEQFYPEPPMVYPTPSYFARPKNPFFIEPAYYPEPQAILPRQGPMPFGGPYGFDGGNGNANENINTNINANAFRRKLHGSSNEDTNVNTNTNTNTNSLEPYPFASPWEGLRQNIKDCQGVDNLLLKMSSAPFLQLGFLFLPPIDLNNNECPCPY